ncbi:glycoside hydrolase family 43 protein [Nesterenkonia alkaliphila]|uniref:1,4-beta-xylanase n=1 Tax=Nesterenkonia alkaliphila TaxID=1463631 RepID=A0A7K1UED7_9MICC|nr:glycoside hydrolase family 43 protein [Nesterenkonia alkaliphila]MVT24799.1 hypothetical protein [Nesterenkonia alkaliphila]GFZ93427.1 hypothetical protein GCM10011359_23560 [Nesterenkonia alkaliphila]
MSRSDLHGYLLVHFVESSTEHTEKIYYSLSCGDDPTTWERLNNGQPVLESALGTTGVRDPHLIRHAEGTGFTLIATDLRVWAKGHHTPEMWDEWTRRGSRSVLLWRSRDLVHWSAPQLKPLAPAEAGMAWALKTLYDPSSSQYELFWSSHLYAEEDRWHTAPSYSRILTSRSSDFTTFTSPKVYLDTGSSVIDLYAVRAGGAVHRFFKEDSSGTGSPGICHEVGGSIHGDFERLAQNIGNDRYRQLEGPAAFPDNRHPRRWYLFLDQYLDSPQGYVGLYSDDIASGQWKWVKNFSMPPNTKHGTVLPLHRGEWERLRAAYP